MSFYLSRNNKVLSVLKLLPSSRVSAMLASYSASASVRSSRTGRSRTDRMRSIARARVCSLRTVSGLSEPTDSTLKKNLLGTLFGSNGASCSFSPSSKRDESGHLRPIRLVDVLLTRVFRMWPFLGHWIDRVTKRIVRIVFERHALQVTPSGDRAARERSTYASGNPFCMFLSEAFARVSRQTQLLVLSKFDNEDI